MTTIIPLTHTPMVRVAPAQVDTTNSYPRSSTNTQILSMNTLAGSVWVLPKSNNTSARAKWIRSVPVMMVASDTASSVVAPYILS